MLSGLLKTDGYANCQGFVARRIEVLKQYSTHKYLQLLRAKYRENANENIIQKYFLGTI